MCAFSDSGWIGIIDMRKLLKDKYEHIVFYSNPQAWIQTWYRNLFSSFLMTQIGRGRYITTLSYYPSSIQNCVD